MHWRRAGVLLALLVALPFVAQASGQEFYIGVASRILIFALAAVSLNLILGFGGMVSFGHAAFVGVGAYTVGILMQYGVVSAWAGWPLAVALGALFTLLVGWGSNPALASSCVLLGAALVGQGCLQFALRREKRARGERARGE